MDKTFSETQGHAPFDWNRWLDNALVEEPSVDEFEQARAKAGDWPTCAVGNQCAIIPRFERITKVDGGFGLAAYGAPMDAALRHMGEEFMEKIQRKEWGCAKYTLLQIEQRSAVLIEEELGKLNQTRQDIE